MAWGALVLWAQSPLLRMGAERDTSSREFPPACVRDKIEGKDEQSEKAKVAAIFLCKDTKKAYLQCKNVYYAYLQCKNKNLYDSR